MAVIATIAYGIITLIGGLIGYIKAKSQASLISGVISGTLLIICGLLQLQGQSWALILARILTLILIVVFALRLKKTGKFMPAGIMLTLGVISLILMVFA